MNFVKYTRYIKENPIIPPSPFCFLSLYSPFPVIRPLAIRHSSLVIFLLFPSLHSPFEGSQRQLGMYPTRAECVIKGWFVSFSSLSPFGGSGAYQISNSLHSPSLRKSARAEYVNRRITSTYCL